MDTACPRNLYGRCRGALNLKMTGFQTLAVLHKVPVIEPTWAQSLVIMHTTLKLDGPPSFQAYVRSQRPKSSVRVRNTVILIPPLMFAAVHFLL